MKWKNYFLSIFLLLFNIELGINSACQRREARLKSTIRGKYQNVLNYNMGAVISTKLQNGFAGSIQGSCLRDTIYTITTGYGYTASTIGNSIILDLQEQYELNTLKIWFWDQTYRFYTIKIYLIYNNLETNIYESNLVQSITTITFPDQFVQKFKIQQFLQLKQIYFLINYIQSKWQYQQNLQCIHTQNTGLHLIKVQAYYKLQTNV